MLNICRWLEISIIVINIYQQENKMKGSLGSDSKPTWRFSVPFPVVSKGFENALVELRIPAIKTLKISFLEDEDSTSN